VLGTQKKSSVLFGRLKINKYICGAHGAQMPRLLAEELKGNPV
jgi:hypothetical protein